MRKWVQKLGVKCESRNEKVSLVCVLEHVEQGSVVRRATAPRTIVLHMKETHLHTIICTIFDLLQKPFGTLDIVQKGGSFSVLRQCV